METANHTPTARGLIEHTLHMRAAAYSVVQECLRLQVGAPPQSRLARLFGADPITPSARSWYRGALGEIAVAAILRELGPDWFVLNAVPLGAEDSCVDHILIGPPGVFAINAENHSGHEVWVSGGVFMVDWEKRQCIGDAEREADRASTLLSDAVGVPIDVTPCIVVVDPRTLTIAKPPRRVAVLTPRQLRGWVTGLRPINSPHTVAFLGMFAEERSTWHEQRSVYGEARQHVLRFQRLQSEVAHARRRRIGWTTGGIVVVWCAFIASLGGVAIGLASLLLPR